MAENTGTGPSSSNLDNTPASGFALPTRERVGEILKRAREARQISIESVARRLRLNAKYIESLEANRYEELPGDTYIRVYLRSLSSFLTLDSEEIFRQFFEERGLTGADTLRKDSKTKINLAAVPDKEKPGAALIITLSVIALLAIVSFIFNSQGWFSSHHTTPAQTGIDSAAHRIRTTPAVAKDSSAKNAVPLTGPVVHTDTSAVVEKTVFNEKKAAEQKQVAAVVAPIKQMADTPHLVTREQIAVRQLRDTLTKGKSTVAVADIKASVKTEVMAAVKNEVKAIVTAPVGPKDTHTTRTKDTVQKSAAVSAVKVKDTVKQKNETVKNVKDSLSKTVKTVDTKVNGSATAAIAASQTVKKPMKLRMTVVGDSCWARVFSDGGNQWRRVVANGKGVTCTAQDSFNVHVGSVSAVVFTLNGEPLTLPDKKGVLFFKIDKDGKTSFLTSEQWNKTFQDRF